MYILYYYYFPEGIVVFFSFPPVWLDSEPATSISIYLINSSSLWNITVLRGTVGREMETISFAHIWEEYSSFKPLLA